MAEHVYSMRCINLRKATHEKGGLNFSKHKQTPGLVPIEIECRKCLPCRLKQARDKAIRCVHESSMFEDNWFLTVTYKDPAPKKLIYRHWQLFMKRLRKEHNNQAISFMVTGEYGEKTKRPHWHAILFNLRLPDIIPYRKNDRGDLLWRCPSIDKIWGYNDPILRPNELGSVSMDSASYVARYAAKKLVHGYDDAHDLHPIHKTSSRRAIGKLWIEQHFAQTFYNGYVTLPGGAKAAIPRYYKDWCKEHHPEVFRDYQLNVLPKIAEKINRKERRDEIQYITDVINHKRSGYKILKRSEVEHICLEQKFKQLKGKL